MSQITRSIVTLALLLGGCTAASTGTSPSPRSPVTTATIAIHLAGHIILGANKVYNVANADGTAVKPLHEPGQYCCLARISPDHTRIITMPGTDETGGLRGGTLTLEGSEFELLPRSDKTLNLVPQAWSPDGSRIAFEGWDESDPTRTGIYTARATDGGDLVRVTTRLGRPHDMPLDYSPDGSQLVFYRAIRAEPNFPIDIGGSLWVVNADGSDPHELDTGDVRPWWHARWSPDGPSIVFGIERLQLTGGLWNIKPDGSGLTKLFDDPDGGFPGAPVWSPDGRKIMFQIDPINDAFQHPDNAIYVINADGTGLTLVIDGPGRTGVTDWWD
ncbi:MAG TPA: hypothetical protein VEQ37_17040 [Actinomycetota bacterium]|nr:hypothetical protein [Actinomycetota bacterium]